jgi:hypothetical protein
MFTLFDLFQVLGPIFGFIIGGAFGAEYGVPLGIAGALCGGYLALHLGRLPTKLMVRSARKDFAPFLVSDLEAKLDGGCWAPNLILMELKARGEDVTKHLPFVLSLLQDEEFFRRTRGYAASLSAFPNDARELADYNPTKSVEDCRNALSALTTKAEQDGGGQPATRPESK